MSSLLKIEDYPKSESLLEAVTERFSRGDDMVKVANGSQLFGILSPDATAKQLARKVAEQWAEHPDMLDELASSLEEEADDWNE